MAQPNQPAASITSTPISATSSHPRSFAVRLIDSKKSKGLLAKRSDYTEYPIRAHDSNVGYRMLDYMVTEPTGSTTVDGAPASIGLLRRDAHPPNETLTPTTVSGFLISSGFKNDRKVQVARLDRADRMIPYECKYPGTIMETLDRLSDQLTTTQPTTSSLPIPPVITYKNGESMPSSVHKTRLQAFESSEGDLLVGMPYRYYTACAHRPGKFTESLDGDGDDKEDWWRLWNLGNMSALEGDHEADKGDSVSMEQSGSGCLDAVRAWPRTWRKPTPGSGTHSGH